MSQIYLQRYVFKVISNGKQPGGFFYKDCGISYGMYPGTNIPYKVVTWFQVKYKNGERSSALPEDNMWDSETFISYLRGVRPTITTVKEESFDDARPS